MAMPGQIFRVFPSPPRTTGKGAGTLTHSSSATSVADRPVWLQADEGTSGACGRPKSSSSQARLLRGYAHPPALLCPGWCAQHCGFRHFLQPSRKFCRFPQCCDSTGAANTGSQGYSRGPPKWASLLHRRRLSPPQASSCTMPWRLLRSAPLLHGRPTLPAARQRRAEISSDPAS